VGNLDRQTELCGEAGGVELPAVEHDDGATVALDRQLLAVPLGDLAPRREVEPPAIGSSALACADVLGREPLEDVRPALPGRLKQLQRIEPGVVQAQILVVTDPALEISAGAAVEPDQPELAALAGLGRDAASLTAMSDKAPGCARRWCPS
jgi:hypothetical protein